MLEERAVSLFFSESPTNPYLRCVDVPRIAQLCHAKGTLVVVDSTFATPVNQRVCLLAALHISCHWAVLIKNGISRCHFVQVCICRMRGPCHLH